jgi:hypothetical protein
VTNRPDIEVLAEGPRESAEALAVRLAELRSRKATILECIKYVKLNQGCSLGEAKDIVVNSIAWLDRRDEFLQHQQDMFEEFLASSRDQIESIQQTITPDGTKFVVRMKTPAGSSQDSAEPLSWPWDLSE